MQGDMLETITDSQHYDITTRKVATNGKEDSRYWNGGNNWYTPTKEWENLTNVAYNAFYDRIESAIEETYSKQWTETYFFD